MTVRAFLFVVVVSACHAASAASAPGPAVPAGEPMTYYIVKGAPDSCGRGCDSWIEVEGRIERTTAAPFKTFLDRMPDPLPPLYLDSPGGDLAQAIKMGGALHARLSIARVGRTLVRECGFEAQDSDVCVKVKQSGQHLHGDLITRGARCVSACPFVFAGAAVHEVAPDAFLGVHSAQAVLNRADPTNPTLIEADQRAQFRSDHLIAQYLASVGIEAGLLGLAKTIRFEEMHYLTREEVARFGLDRRDYVETPWNFESSGRSMIHKIVVVRSPGDTSFRTIQWWVICFDADRFVLDFERPAPANPASSSVSIKGGDAKLMPFGHLPVKASGQEQWILRASRATIQSLLDTPRVEFTETSLAADGQRLPRTFTFSNDGFAFAMNRLMATCPSANNQAAREAGGLPKGAGK
jgi:hypothetical protein